MSDWGTQLPDVSRETFNRLETYVALLRKWSPRINLVSRNSLEDVWTRHVRDSLQLWTIGKPLSGHWLDIGSGGGFPGLVIAICAQEAAERVLQVTLIESDQRKAAFLRTVLRETGVSADIVSQRIEATPPQNADIMTARALAPLSNLLEFAEMHLAHGGTALFSKGARWKNELAEAQKAFSFDCAPIKSETQSAAVILKIRNISRV